MKNFIHFNRILIKEQKMTEENLSYLFDTYSDMILKIAYTYLKNTNSAEDILQEVLLKVLKKKMYFEDEKQEKYWLIRVTINLCKDFLKSAWYRKNVPLEENISYLPKEQGEILKVVLALPEKYKMVIYLYYYEGFSLQEIAKIWHKKTATIGTWLARARKMLKEKLKGEWDL